MKRNNGLAPLMPETESGNRKKKHIFHTRFKVLIVVLTILVILFGAIACHSLKSEKTPAAGSDPASSDSSSDVSDGTQSGSASGDSNSAAENDEKNSKSSESNSKTQQLGAEKYGSITAPDTWKPFSDPDASSITGGALKQYCDETGKLIITLNYTESPQTDAKSAASSCWAQMEDDGASDIQGATVTIADCEAYQVYGYYTEDDVMLVIWVFTDQSGVLHYISAEGPIDTVMSAVKLVEDTYTLSAN